MDTKEIESRVRAARTFTKCALDQDEGFVSDQDQRLPQPPLTKGPMTDNAFRLPNDFSGLSLADDYARLVSSRRTRRVYTAESITLTELSFLLWATQGVESIRGRNYATLRTVPSGGARHAFETYLVINHVDGLEPGVYHYLPMTHALEFLSRIDDPKEKLGAMLMGQIWAAKASVVFFYSFVPYRAEWRYGFNAHRIAMVDLGHIGQALYLSCEALGFGTCGIGAFVQSVCDEVFTLDGENEYTVYAQPVGRYKASDAPKELEFYAFLNEEE